MSAPDEPSDELRLELSSMPDDLMALAKDQFGSHFLQFEIWAGEVVDKAYRKGWHQGWKDAPSDDF